MKLSIAELEIPSKLSGYKVIGSGTEPNWVPNLTRVNILVGPNNSGKSRFLRCIASSLKTPTHFRPKQIDIATLANDIAEGKANILASINEYSVIQQFQHSQEKKIVEEALSGIPQDSYFTIDENPFISGVLQQIEKIENLGFHTQGQYSHGGRIYNLRNFVEGVKAIASELRQKLSLDEFPPVPSFKTIYIPSLRGIRTLYSSSDIYADRTKKDYFSKGEVDAPTEIFTGYTLYQEIKKLLLGDLQQRKLVTEFEKFLSENFFEGEKIALIPRDIQDSDDLYIKIGSEDEFPVQELGDGIQQIITLTFPLFRDRELDLVICIEEPELYLHPGMQRILLDTLLRGSYFKNHQFFLTTHSNHFLDLTLDRDNISIYAFTKVSNQESNLSNFEIENVEGDKTNVLNSLGVKNSSVFLTNCTVWVEGITDRYYIRHYLDLFQKSLNQPEENLIKEDLHFSFVEYAGDNINHWSFLDYEEKPINVERLCGKLILITDNDGETKLERKNKLKRFLGKRYLCLKSREIENLLKKEILLEIIKDYEKEETFRYKNFNEEDYKSEYLGHFIEKKILTRRVRRGTYQLPSGTIADKLGFCKKAIKYLKSFDDLSLEAKKLTKTVYKFIKENNSLD